jgi:hypothetical protein
VAHGELEPGSTDPLGRRRHRAAARRVAIVACNVAASLHAVFGDRPDLAQARVRSLGHVRTRAAQPGPSSAQALAEVARAALALDGVPEDGDWEVGAIAFVDESALRDLYWACLVLAAICVREAVAA